MKFCTKCGKEILDEAVICPHCGCKAADNSIDDAPSKGFAILGFFIPLVGLILYLMYKDKEPLKAKSAGKGALIGFCTGIALAIIYFVFVSVIIGSIYSSLFDSINSMY